MKQKFDIGLIGLAVMGQNLVLNMNDHGYRVAVYNRTSSKLEDFLKGPAAGRDSIEGADDLKQFISMLERPRKVFLMVKAGDVVDQVISQILPFLEEGDVIIDGGNSLFTDSSRRMKNLAEKNILFIGTGVSGGEEGARRGPSIMPGGNPAAWTHVKSILQDISAKTIKGEPCCDWVGDEGSGHYVKMIHNGIEYGDMQLISEAYHLMKSVLKLDHDRMHEIFEKWNKGPLDSYLIEITSDILSYKDADGEPLLEKILDTAGQKGTGKWTGINALETGTPLTLISEAVFARCLSALKQERVAASECFTGPENETPENVEELIDDLEKALLASKIVSYAQGFMLMRQGALENQWELNYEAVARMWRGGCIIRSRFLDNISDAFSNNKELASLIVDPYFSKILQDSQAAWRRIINLGVQTGIPLPAMSSGLMFFDGYRSASLPANMLQAQRDYFGAHTYERNDSPRGKFYHTDWTGEGGNVSSTTYNV
ncbi:MAG: decarboxylating NADP(+)-dependent phosphogluconate dehydrogenase [Spirochaetales bacterium]|uniref:6-phosphogluconate dehydrogenase, decarboxylating n=1 Tax=Candidatus Thalassospirochaeta sargassi TaxID=3119039 RepID=A0AAJ1ID05_9SPIO|nr:decarboxylating NADP(+)-dependent phosphogluconate dehydrogenase [Spirochaetales bacterium]